MANYIVGDIQGCLDPLHRLLDQVRFNPTVDRLICTGDLINRGPKSLETLKFLRSLGGSAEAVLGNHDLHLLAIYYGNQPLKASDTLGGILAATDCAELCQWLRMRPLLIEDTGQRWLSTHAGLPHIWDRQTVTKCARELEAMIQGPNHVDYFQAMYGNKPAIWDQHSTGMDRLRVITNYLTRMRIINAEGRLQLQHKDKPVNLPSGYFPWFERRHADWQNYRFFFGHWASLEGKTNNDWAIALDAGCVWGGSMCLYRVEDDRKFFCEC